jgi:sugar fermentation stimulation protein A
MIKFPPLTEALFLERPNRFLVKVEIDGRPVFAHLHDPGRLRELLVPGAKLYLQKANNPQRKTRWDIILVEKGAVYVAIYSTLVNRLAKKLFANQTFPGFKSWKLVKSEPAYGNSRFDFELSRGREKMLVEVKSVSLVEDGIAPPTAGFPDAPTERGRRHLLELADAVSRGYKSSVIFIVTRNDATLFQPHTERDPRFAETLKQVANQGVKIHCFKCDVGRKSMALDSKIPVRFC